MIVRKKKKEKRKKKMKNIYTYWQSEKGELTIYDSIHANELFEKFI